MANCCGGKNAGKRISWKRYIAGLSVFLGYHGAVMVSLHALAVPFKSLKKVRNFQRNVFMSELKEILSLDDINVNGRLDEELVEKVCEIDEMPSAMAANPPDESQLASS